jgi:hypothetical protein
LRRLSVPFLIGTDRAAVPSRVGAQESVHASLVGHGDVGAVLRRSRA